MKLNVNRLRWLLNGILCASAAGWIGCATISRETPEQAYERFKAEEYVLHRGADNQVTPLLSLRVWEVTLDEQRMLIHPNSLWANQIRNAITNLFTALQERQAIHGEAPRATESPREALFRGTLTFREKAHIHGASLAKGALVAGLSLGILGNSAVTFDLESNLELEIRDRGGKVRQYLATNTVTGQNRPRDNGAGFSAARVRANSVNVDSLVEKIVQDKVFYAAAQ